MEENLKQLQNTGNEIIKIAIYGPESTGKTTLARQLAAHYNTVWAPEFARDYLQEKWDSKKEICVANDLMPIAIGQMQLENEAVLKANTYLFSDTCLMITKVFSEIYYGFFISIFLIFFSFEIFIEGFKGKFFILFFANVFFKFLLYSFPKLYGDLILPPMFITPL